MKNTLTCKPQPERFRKKTLEKLHGPFASRAMSVSLGTEHELEVAFGIR